MIAVAIDGPVRKQDVGLFGLDEFSKLIIAGVVDDRMAIALGGEDGSRLQNAAGFLGFRDAHVATYIRSCLRTGLFTTIQIQKRDIMSELGVARDRPAAAVLGIAGVAATDDDLKFGACARGLPCSSAKR